MVQALDGVKLARNGRKTTLQPIAFVPRSTMSRDKVERGIEVQTRSAPQNDRLNLSFVQDSKVVVKQMARNGRKMAISAGGWVEVVTNKQQKKIVNPRRAGCSQGCLCRIKNSSLISFCPAQCKMK